MVELSVVVPVYKAEQYLKKCINSILEQTFCDFELILVDDGSPDSCPDICDQFCSIDPRVHVIHQDNQGSIKARRNGLESARGEYVIFTDADDYVDPEYYFRLMKLAKENGADIVVSGYREGTEENAKGKENRIASGVYRDKDLSLLKNRCLFYGEYYQAGIIPALWNKVIRRKMFEQIDPAGSEIRMGEDAILTYPLLKTAECIVVDNENKGYFYRIVEGSMSRKPDPSYFDRVVVLFAGLTKQLKDDTSMMYQLDYYILFILEVGMRQLITKENLLNPFKIRNTIHQVIRHFDLPSKIAGMDCGMMKQGDLRRVQLLQNDHPGRYVMTVLKEIIRDRQGQV